jgi:hypothetical protein
MSLNETLLKIDDICVKHCDTCEHYEDVEFWQEPYDACEDCIINKIMLEIGKENDKRRNNNRRNDTSRTT